MCLATRKTPTSCSVGSFNGSSCPASRLRLTLRSPIAYNDWNQRAQLCDQFVENVGDVQLRWDMKRRIEEDAAAGFLVLRKVALRWRVRPQVGWRRM